MDSIAPRKTGPALFEYFLYFAIILETGLAAVFYKLAFQNSGLSSLKTYFGVAYFLFLGWAISQLNRLHRRRRKQETVEQPEPLPAPVMPPPESPIRDGEEPSERARPFLGLTVVQLAIILIVFGTAVATFSWAFSVFQAGR